MGNLRQLLFILPFFILSEAEAGKGANIRIFNLTDYQLDCIASVDNFKQEAELRSTLTGSLPSRGMLPKDSSLYIEENTGWWELAGSNELSISIKAAHSDQKNLLGEHSVAFSYTSTNNYRAKQPKRTGLLRVVSVISPSSYSETETVISVFILDRDVSAKDWMTQLRGSIRLSDLLIPGTHDSTSITDHSDDPLIFPLLFVWTQDEALRKQMEAGVRYFDIRGKPAGDRIVNMHSFYPVGGTWKGNLETAVNFLRKHPGETILFQLKLDRGSDSDAKPILKKDLAGFKDYIYQGPFRKVGSSDRKRTLLPTLEEARGKIVLINRMWDGSDPDFPSMDFSINDGFADNATFFNRNFSAQDVYDNPKLAQKKNVVSSFFVDSRRSARLNLNFLSASGGKDNALVRPSTYALGSYQQELSENNSSFVDMKEGMNLFAARFFNSRPYFPNFDSVILMDFAVEEDPLAQIAYLSNFYRDGRTSSVPINGASYYLYSAVDPEMVLNLDVSRGANATVHSLHPRGGVWPWQRFRYQDGKLISQSHDGSLLYLSNVGGIQGTAFFQGARSEWTIVSVEGTPYVRVEQQSIPPSYLEVSTGELKNGSRVSAGHDESVSGKGFGRQLWLLQKAEP